MSITVHITVEAHTLDSIAANAPGADGLIADLASASIQADAQSMAPVRTGFLRGSITRLVSGGRFVVSALAGYAGFVEYGTRHMAAQPFMTPAAERVNLLDLAREALHTIGL